MFFMCCCSKAEGGDVVDEKRVVKDTPREHHLEEGDVPAAMWSPPSNDANDAAKKESGSETQGYAPGTTFNTMIMRQPGASIGLDIDLIDGVSAVIVEVKDGVVSSYNDQQPDRALRVHDRIIEVNGVRGSANSIVAQLKSDMTWNLVVQRPTEFLVSITRADAPTIGMDLRYAPNGNTLMITRVGEGPMEEWNARNPDKAVCKHDRIVQLNDVRGAPLRLLQASEGLETLQMTIIHYPPGGTA